MPIGLPSCRKCLGTGEIEIITVRDGEISGFTWEPCTCTYHIQWKDEEDWTNERHQNLPR